MYVCTYTSQHPALTQHQTSKIQSENFIAKVVYQLDVVNIVSKLIETFGYLLKTCNIFSNSAMFDHLQKQHDRQTARFNSTHLSGTWDSKSSR